MLDHIYNGYSLVVQKRGHGGSLLVVDSGGEPPNSVNLLEIRAYKNHYSVAKCSFRSKKLSRNC